MFVKIRDTVKEHGLAGLLRRGLTFPARRRWLGMKYEELYCYEHTMKERPAQKFLPARGDFTLHIVRTNEEADALEKQGYEFRSQVKKARKALDAGAVAFCIFVEHKLAHIGWVALAPEGKPYVDNWPFRVDFASKEAVTGSTETFPGYQGFGFMKYGYYQRFEFLREMGVVRTRNSVSIYNTASNHVHAMFEPRIYARARYFQILGRVFWKELPL